MKVSVEPSAIRETKWHEYVVRFVFGGLVTAMAGVIAAKCGPVVGGLFLAFPAIFPASATLVEKHESRKKEEQGLEGKERGREAAGAEAAGAAMGSIGLLAFGWIVWWLTPRFSAWPVLAGATAAWFAISALVWMIRKKV